VKARCLVCESDAESVLLRARIAELEAANAALRGQMSQVADRLMALAERRLEQISAVLGGG
jgi:hypothetical protein